MIPLRSDVTTLVASLLGDTQTATPALYTSAFQAPFLNVSFQELYGKLKINGADQIQREGYYLLPAFTGVLFPATAKLSNFDHPIEIDERGSATSLLVIGASVGTGTCTLTLGTSLPSYVVTGSEVDVYGVAGLTDDVNDTWIVTVNSPTSITLNGCATSGSWGGGGTVVVSSENWSGPLDPKANTDTFPTNAPGSLLGMYCWQKGVIRFPACSTARELRIIYQLSGSLPVVASPVSTDSMVVDDSLSFLANRTAQYCGKSKGNPTWQECQKQADYFLDIMLSEQVRAMQDDASVVPAPFRPKRNIPLSRSVW